MSVKMRSRFTRVFLATTMYLLFAAFPGIASATIFDADDGVFGGTLDGILTSSSEYGTNSFSTEWYNDHHTILFPEGGGQTTTVRWHNDVTNGDFYLYLEAPLTVKNMVWGNFFDKITNPGYEAEALLYYESWCSPNNGQPAERDGSNCGHHNGGFSPDDVDEDKDKTFVAKMVSGGDFKTMVDSEKVQIDDGKFKLIDTKEPDSVHGALVYSSSYLHI